MRKIVTISIISILAAACYNNPEYVILGNTQSSHKISPCIEEAFAYSVKHDGNPDTSTIYLMEFLVGEPGFPRTDTLICFCMCHERQSQDGLRGIMTLGDYKVLVFDKQNVGKDFYNEDSLVNTDLNRLRLSTSKDMIDCWAFVLDGDPYLYLLGCQPDDFVPIKIDR